MEGDTDIKIGRQVDHSRFKPTNDKEAWSSHAMHFKFWGCSHPSGTTEARVVKFCTIVTYGMGNVSPGMTRYRPNGTYHDWPAACRRLCESGPVVKLNTFLSFLPYIL